MPKTERQKISRQACVFTNAESERGSASLATGGDNGPPRFSMLALSGKIIPNHWLWGNLALDLKGGKADNKRMPVLREHVAKWIVGFTDTVEFSDKGLILEGPFSQVTEDGIEVLALAKEKFPWQASVFAIPLEIERIFDGEMIEVNGHKLKGPGTVFRKWRLREGSFVALGSDAKTKAVSLADGDAEEFEIEITEKLTEKEGENMAKKEEGTGLKVAEVEPSAVVATATHAQLRADRPEFVEALLKEGAEAERERIAKLTESAFEGQGELLAELVKSGATIEAGVLKFNEAEKLAGKQRLEDLKTGAAPAVGASEDPDTADAKLAALTADTTPAKSAMDKAIDTLLSEKRAKDRTEAMQLLEKEQPTLRQKYLAEQQAAAAAQKK